MLQQVTTHNTVRAGEMAQSLKCLSHKQEDLRLISRTHIKEKCPQNLLGGVMHACSPSAEMADRQRLGLCRTGEVQTGEKYSQKSSWILRSDSPLSPTYKYTSVHICASPLWRELFLPSVGNSLPKADPECPMPSPRVEPVHYPGGLWELSRVCRACLWSSCQAKKRPVGLEASSECLRAI